jgi:hypothetical protein
MFRSIIQHPLLLLNGFQSILYYVCEVILYHQPLGVVLIVIAALTSSFVIVPLEGWFGIVDHAVDPLVMTLGVIGSLLCIMEKKAASTDGTISQMYHVFWLRVKAAACCKPSPVDVDEDTLAVIPDSHFEGYGGVSGSNSLSESVSDEQADGRRSSSSASDYSTLAAGGLALPPPPPSLLRSVLLIGVPFLGLSLTYSLWFVTQKIFNNQYRTNALGYTSIDQVLVPLYMWLFLIVVEWVPTLKRLLVNQEEQQESFGDAVRVTFQKLFAHNGRGFFTIFFYRLLANGRAIAYFYLGVIYDLNVVYVELTFVRIVLSWLLSVAVCAFAPQFLGLSELERRTVFSPMNVIFRVAGTGLVVAALMIGN